MDRRDTVDVVANAGWDQRVIVCRCGPLIDTFIIVSERYVVLVDTLVNRASATALLDIAKPYLTRDRQLLVVNTHADWDHAWGNHVFAGPDATHAAPIIASRKCAERLRAEPARQKLAAKRAEMPCRFDDVVLTPPTLLFNERLAIDGGDLTIELFATPGHTSDHVSIFVPEIGTLFPGDAAELPFPIVEGAAAIPDMTRSLARMAALSADTVLYCHAPVTSGAALLQGNMAYFAKIEAACRAALARGVVVKEQDDVEALVGFPFEAALPEGADVAALRGFYHPGHVRALRAMLQHLSVGLR